MAINCEESLFIGIDGGGTKTHAAVIDTKGQLIYEAAGNSSNVALLGVDATFSNLKTIMDDITLNLGDLKQHIAVVVLGLAGISDAESKLKQGLLSKFNTLGISKHVEIVNDAHIAWYAIEHGQPAIALICGTGSACFSIDANGTKIIKGGMGHVLSDEGSGYQIGLMGIRRALRAQKGIELRTALTEEMVRFFSISDVDEAPYRIRDHKEIASFAQKVYEISLTGDQTANEIIEQAALDLATLVEAAWREGDFQNETVRVGTFGSCLVHMHNLRSIIYDHLSQVSLSLKLCLPALSPERAAAEMARNIQKEKGDFKSAVHVS